MFDTDILTLFLSGNSQVGINVVMHDPAELSVSIVTVEEACRGRLAQLHQARTRDQTVRAYEELERLFDSLRQMTVLSFDRAAAARYDEFRRQHRRAGANDLRIAAIAVERGVTLVTANTRDFAAISGLSIEDWSV